MSRIGKQAIIIPNDIEVKINKCHVCIEGKKGTLEHKLPKEISINKEGNQLKLSKQNEDKKTKQLYGLSRSIINNMVVGVSQGFTKKLVIQGVGYRSQIDGKSLILNVGYSHSIRIEPPKDIKITVENNTNISISGIKKETVGQIAATIRNIRSPEPYKGKGIKYENEIIRRKVGKAGK